ncbi:MAG: glycosyltransferase [Candidatus Cloacimonetes bacterium]|nr:glycosyltransferase [Candidatus Cloacimonadota bacterium]
MARRSQNFTGPAAAPRTRRLVWVLLGFVALQLAVLAWTVLRPAEVLPATIVAAPRLVVALQLAALLAVLVLAWRAALFARYRPLAGVPDAELPAISVIVPAYNEGRQVLDTVRSLMAGDYPASRLQIITIDDGSQDDTWTWIQRGADEFPDHVLALRCPENRGKREALYEGFQRATGEVIVTVDSDSEVLPDALRNLVTPLVRDPRVGAVSGNVRVLNRDGGALPAMMDVTFTTSFEFIRVTQSEVGVVMCCPGALSAYRRDLVTRFQDEWVTQTFLGQPASIGEDRAMTNLVLRMGHEVHFQSNAIVVTKVPTGTRQLARMLLRWARSDVRETLTLAQILWRRPGAWSWGAHVNFIASALGLALSPVMFVWLAAAAVLAPALIAWTLFGVLLAAAMPALIFGHLREARSAWWAFPYGLYSLLCLSWIRPYALVTPHHASWLTRALPRATTPTPSGDRRDHRRRRAAGHLRDIAPTSSIDLPG